MNTRRYASTIHCNWRVVAPRSVDSDGSAMLTIRPSSVVTNTATHSTARTNQRRVSASGRDRRDPRHRSLQCHPTCLTL